MEGVKVGDRIGYWVVLDCPRESGTTFIAGRTIVCCRCCGKSFEVLQKELQEELRHGRCFRCRGNR